MKENLVKSEWKLQSIEYSGIGNKPHFILMNDQGDFKMEPIDNGIHNLRKLLNLES
tara:strand:+ start:270 stop:437 length:168 start_codon:yes stop_codon:yes gene_type:complete